MSKNEHLYFTPQTGVWKLKRSKAPSNYYTYRLPFKYLGRIQAAVRDAEIGSGGLEYPPEFLKWLEANDTAFKP